MNYKYRKRPVEIEAFQLTYESREDNSEWPQWLHEAWNKEPEEVGSIMTIQNSPYSCRNEDRALCIHTLEGVLHVGWGDYLIRGVWGELYACKPDIFELTYESVS